jgi:pilus assembly protein Flp/PilA
LRKEKKSPRHKLSDFVEILAFQHRQKQKPKSFSAKHHRSARSSLLPPYIKTSEQLANGIERMSRIEISVAGVAEMFVSVLSKVAARFVRDQRGATMLEYGLLVGLVAIAAIVAVTAMGGALSSMFTDAANAL